MKPNHIDMKEARYRAKHSTYLHPLPKSEPVPIAPRVAPVPPKPVPTRPALVMTLQYKAPGANVLDCPQAGIFSSPAVGYSPIRRLAGGMTRVCDVCKCAPQMVTVTDQFTTISFAYHPSRAQQSVNENDYVLRNAHPVLKEGVPNMEYFVTPSPSPSPIVAPVATSGVHTAALDLEGASHTLPPHPAMPVPSSAGMPIDISPIPEEAAFDGAAAGSSAAPAAPQHLAPATEQVLPPSHNAGEDAFLSPEQLAEIAVRADVPIPLLATPVDARSLTNFLDLCGAPSVAGPYATGHPDPDLPVGRTTNAPESEPERAPRPPPIPAPKLATIMARGHAMPRVPLQDLRKDPMPCETITVPHAPLKRHGDRQEYKNIDGLHVIDGLKKYVQRTEFRPANSLPGGSYEFRETIEHVGGAPELRALNYFHVAKVDRDVCVAHVERRSLTRRGAEEPKTWSLWQLRMVVLIAINLVHWSVLDVLVGDLYLSAWSLSYTFFSQLLPILLLTLVPNRLLYRHFPTFVAKAWVYKHYILWIHFATVYAWGFVSYSLVGTLFLYAVVAIIRRLPRGPRVANPEIAHIEILEERALNLVPALLVLYSVVALGSTYTHGFYHALFDPFLSLRSWSFVASMFITQATMGLLFRFRSWCRRYKARASSLGVDFTPFTELWLPQDDSIMVEKASRAYVPFADGHPGTVTDMLDFPDTKKFVPYQKLILVILDQTEVATLWEPAETYCPNLLSAILVECRNNSDTVRETGRQVALRLAAPLNIPAGILPSVIEGTYSLACVIAQNPQDFLCRSSLAGGVAGQKDL